MKRHSVDASRVTDKGWCDGSSEPAFHIFTVSSELAVARRRPSGLNETALTASLWPARVGTSSKMSLHNLHPTLCIDRQQTPAPRTHDRAVERR